MTAVLAGVGWALATALLLAGGAARRRAACRAELVARACHELRGPLTAAGLALEAAPRDPLVAARAAEHELARAGRALDDLRLALEGRRAPDDRAAVHVGPLLCGVRDAWAPAFAAAGRPLVLEPGAAGVVRGDAVRLRQALGNLVGNALEHGAGAVVLRATGAAGRVRLEVEDRGAGLPAPVAQLTAAARDGRGARGRGLAIAAEIAARHGGRLTAAPSARGARLVLDLPASSVTAVGRRAGVADPGVPA